MKRGFKCRKEVLEVLKTSYDEIVLNEWQGCFLKALKNFDFLAENNLRSLLKKYYSNERSRDQAWKTCKGSLYEYAVFKYITHLIESNGKLKERIGVLIGDDILISHKEQIAIKNWCYIFPDADIVVLERNTGLIKAILSCKTSLRERLTETAFWKRELEKEKEREGIKLIFVTTDKDGELKTETNRYILLHIVDYTFITDPNKYQDLMSAYKKKYGKRKDFNSLVKKVKFIDEMENILHLL